MLWWCSADSAKVKAAALRSWAFLYTSLNTPLSSRQLDGQLAALAGLLHDQDVEVRQAAGEGLALLYNTCGLAECDEEDDEDDYSQDEDEPQQGEATEPASTVAVAGHLDLSPAGETTAAAAAPADGAGSSSGVEAAGGQPLGPGVLPARRHQDEMSTCSSVSGLDMVMDRVKELANNRGDRQRRSKRERVALKGCFREMRKIMEVRVWVMSCLLKHVLVT